ncbi:hypothetical protein KBZ21_54410, partial [Streptomyces sp. A73]|nr:hypothetical protein [Streptomyces sp. A73]
TKIWKLRIGGAGRLWGFLVGHVFHIIWRDPDHQVWPSKKKNTRTTKPPTATRGRGLLVVWLHPGERFLHL